MISLSTCVEGQKLRLRDGRIVMYAGLTRNSDYPHKTTSLEDENLLYTYKHNGDYNSEYGLHFYDVIEILPLETTEPDPHPSVVWWESCPWITDRKPTKEDGAEHEAVITKKTDSSAGLTIFWEMVEEGQPWIHRQDWQPPALSNKEQAIKLIEKHKEGWTPTLDEWTIIHKGLTE